jgi:hypothetical protein
VSVYFLILILIVLCTWISSAIVLHSYQIFAILTEDGICTDGTHKIVPSQILNYNGVNGSFAKLMSDNRELAEIVCHNLLNGNATIDMTPSNQSVAIVN